MDNLSFNNQVISFLKEGHVELPDISSLEEKKKITFLFEKVMGLVKSSSSLTLIEKIKCSLEEATVHLEEDLQQAAGKIIETAQSKLASCDKKPTSIDEAVAFLSQESDLEKIKIFLDPLVKSGEGKKLLEVLDEFFDHVDWNHPPNTLLIAHDHLINDKDFVESVAVHSDLGVLEHVDSKLMEEDFILALAEKAPLSKDSSIWLQSFFHKNSKIDQEDFVKRLNIAVNVRSVSTSEFGKLIEGAQVFWEKNREGGKIVCNYGQIPQEEFIFPNVPDFISKLLPDILHIEIESNRVGVSHGIERKLNLKHINADYESFQKERKEELSKLRKQFKALRDSVSQNNIDDSLVNQIKGSNFEKLFDVKLTEENIKSLPFLEEALSEIKTVLSHVKTGMTVSTMLAGFFTLSGGEYTLKVPEDLKFEKVRKIEGIDVIDRLTVSETTPIVIKATERANLLELKGIEYKNGDLHAINLASDRIQFIIEGVKLLHPSKHEEGWLLL